MTHDVILIEINKGNSFDRRENFSDLFQPRAGAGREIDLGNISRNDCLGPETQPGEKHHHLFGGSVLGFIQDNEGVVQGAAAHEGQGSDFNDAFLHELGGFIKIHHIIEGVIKGPQVGINFFIEIAR